MIEGIEDTIRLSNMSNLALWEITDNSNIIKGAINCKFLTIKIYSKSSALLHNSYYIWVFTGYKTNVKKFQLDEPYHLSEETIKKNLAITYRNIDFLVSLSLGVKVIYLSETKILGCRSFP